MPPTAGGQLAGGRPSRRAPFRELASDTPLSMLLTFWLAVVVAVAVVALGERGGPREVKTPQGEALLSLLACPGA